MLAWGVLGMDLMKPGENIHMNTILYMKIITVFLAGLCGPSSKVNQNKLMTKGVILGI